MISFSPACGLAPQCCVLATGRGGATRRGERACGMRRNACGVGQRRVAVCCQSLALPCAAKWSARRLRPHAPSSSNTPFPPLSVRLSAQPKLALAQTRRRARQATRRRGPIAIVPPRSCAGNRAESALGMPPTCQEPQGSAVGAVGHSGYAARETTARGEFLNVSSIFRTKKTRPTKALEALRLPGA